ncbi:hypothetical protein IHE45_02G082900 [Dioscorea alata]|uniref:Uncharacterized protein n=1 Tax=Dioscorea alata TaxID=55571 RepID=A0ACB7WR89_DIOAL|nr:hypothetical protein IHE45_02G082900 [Dioscorea alata]
MSLLSLKLKWPQDIDRRTAEDSELDPVDRIKCIFPYLGNIVNSIIPVNQTLIAKKKKPSSRWTKQAGYVALSPHSVKRCTGMGNQSSTDVKKEKLQNSTVTAKHSWSSLASYQTPAA